LTYLQEAFDAGQLRFFSSLEALHDPPAFTRYLAPVLTQEWVSTPSQLSLAAAGSGLRRSLDPPSCYFQSSDRGYRRRAGEICGGKLSRFVSIKPSIQTKVVLIKKKNRATQTDREEKDNSMNPEGFPASGQA
jgi:hypothetical protein